MTITRADQDMCMGKFWALVRKNQNEIRRDKYPLTYSEQPYGKNKGRVFSITKDCPIRKEFMTQDRKETLEAIKWVQENATII